MLSEYDCDDTKTKLVDPSITQLLKNHCRKDFVKIVFDDMGLADAEWILFIVSNYENDLMDSAGKGTGGSHYNLLVYSKKQNTFFDLDPLYFTNGPSVKKLFDNIKELMAEGSTLCEIRCPQQRNGFDCGPYTLLFTERVIEKINTGESIEPIHVKPDDIRRCRSNLRKLIEEEIKSKSKGNKDRHDPRVGDGGKHSKSKTNQGVGVT